MSLSNFELNGLRYHTLVKVKIIEFIPKLFWFPKIAKKRKFKKKAAEMLEGDGIMYKSTNYILT